VWLRSYVFANHFYRSSAWFTRRLFCLAVGLSALTCRPSQSGILSYRYRTPMKINCNELLGPYYSRTFSIRPPDVLVRGLRFYRDSSFFLSFFASCPPSSLNRTQPKPVTCSEVSAIWKLMSEIWSIPSPYKSGTQTPPFSTTSQLNGNFNSLYLRNETWYT